MPSNHKVTFYGEGDHEPEMEPGDVIIQLQEKEHEIFQRHGKDMAMKLDLSLREAVCGFKKAVTTLDNRTIILTSKPGEVFKHGVIKQVPDEGFPVHKDPFNKGKLIVIFNVIFPESVNAEDAKKLFKLLPKQTDVESKFAVNKIGGVNNNKKDDNNNTEEVTLVEFDGNAQWKGGDDDGTEGAEEEEDFHQGPGGFPGGHPGMQCAHQ